MCCKFLAKTPMGVTFFDYVVLIGMTLIFDSVLKYWGIWRFFFGDIVVFITPQCPPLSRTSVRPNGRDVPDISNSVSLGYPNTEKRVFLVKFEVLDSR